MLQPRDWACAFLIFQGGIFSARASSPGLVVLSEATRAAVRTPSAMASAIRTCGTPRSQRPAQHLDRAGPVADQHPSRRR